jgi:hypothetical protein
MAHVPSDQGPNPNFDQPMAEKKEPDIPDNRGFWSIRAPKTTTLFFLQLERFSYAGFVTPTILPQLFRSWDRMVCS